MKMLIDGCKPVVRGLALRVAVVLLAGAASLLVATRLAAQVEEAVEPATYGEATEALEAEFEAAMELFRSARQAESMPLLSQLIDALGETPLPAGRRRDILTQALFRRAEARMNLGENETAEADLEAVATVDPAFDHGSLLVSPKLTELFESARSRVAGYLEPKLDPVDSVVRLDGSPIQLREVGATPVLAGPYQVSIERPGFATVERDIEVAPGATVPLEVTLDRTSATVRVRTLEAGVEVAVDGVGLGVTQAAEPPPQRSAPADAGEHGDPEAAIAPEPSEPPSAELVVDGLAIGEHVLELSQEGYRDASVALTIEALTDYEMEVVELQETRGTLYVDGLPADTTLLVDGEVLFPAGSVEGDINVQLPVGEHLLQIDAGTLGGLDQYFTLEDRGEVRVEARLRPRLVLLGVLGGHADAAQRLRDDLAARFDGHQHWLYSDRSGEMQPHFEDLGLDPDGLRSASDGVDWAQVQTTADRLVPGSVYLVAVLSDDLLAGGADLWTLAAGPAAAVVDSERVDLRSDSGIDAWAAGFSMQPVWSRPWLGATLLDTGLAEGPVIAFADPAGPVSEAGGRSGDVVVAVDGKNSSTAADVVANIATAGERVELALQRGGEAMTLNFTVTRRPATGVDLDSSSPGSAILAWVAIDEVRNATPDWLLALNRAAVYRSRGAWPEVVRALRGVEAPQQAGLGRAAVDYWLGVALLATDPAAYADQAREALARAAESDSGRLGSADGPLVAERASVRLSALTAGR